MQKKALVVDFKNAAIFRNRKPSSDKLFVGHKRIARGDGPVIEVEEGELDVRHVSNMLHVLMGERPVTSFRPTTAKPDPDIEKAASEARFRLEEVSTKETKSCRKAVDNAWQTEKIAFTLNGKSVPVEGGVLYPRRLKRFLGDELYALFEGLDAKLRRENGVRQKLTTQQSLELLNANKRDKRVVAFAAACRTARKTDIANIIEGTGKESSSSVHRGAGSKLNLLLVGSGPEQVSKYKGTIYVPLSSEELLTRIANGCGVATFLEGGMASIAGIEEWSTDLVHDAKSVKLNPIKGNVPVQTP